MHIVFFAIALHREKAIALLSIVSDIQKKRSYVKVGKWLPLEYINRRKEIKNKQTGSPLSNLTPKDIYLVRVYTHEPCRKWRDCHSKLGNMALSKKKVVLKKRVFFFYFAISFGRELLNGV